MNKTNSPMLMDDDDLLNDLLLGEETAPVDQSKADANIDAFPGLPITLSVEMARLAVPLAELKQLQSGDVLVLPEHQDSLMTLRVNNTAIGKAELGRQGDWLNIRLVKVAPSILQDDHE
ncbi:FliM/FliN family flagellar motor switch protein [Ferrimonas lipolytica]|uniref:FliM/FliN family flagellar motor switch protein n=1 Tax=Ferrimonas lipolytica TaxID=2724191 RepID=A0A6H1UCK8_9GAMM|nr:FliM/FliN family flagellar motor C-terminal domain-containing protein [Ferrimonas lipolytica]QIZ76815.1 FliM/FliN family flagellar motor switch protein [Ferrimonas lipolytica]